MNITKIRAITISTAIVLGLSAAAAIGGISNNQFVSDGVNKYIVRFPDLDLSKVDGAAVLYGRLRQAATVVCSPLQRRDLAMNVKYRECVNHAIAGAVANVSSPMLSQYHESHSQGKKTAVAQIARAN